MLDTLMFLRAWAGCRLSRDDRGVTAVEYGLLLALIALVIIGSVFLLGGTLNSMFSSANSCISNKTSCP